MQRHKKFNCDMDSKYAAEIVQLLRAARVMLVEHAMCEALFLSKSSVSAAVTELNAQIKMCSAGLDQDNKPLVKPAEHLHKVIWKNCQRVIRGLSLV